MSKYKFDLIRLIEIYFLHINFIRLSSLHKFLILYIRANDIHLCANRNYVDLVGNIDIIISCKKCLIL